MIAQDLWEAHYQIVSIIFLKDFIELNVNQDIAIKNVKHEKLNISIATFFFEYTNFKVDLIEYKYLNCNISYQRKFDEK